MGIFSGIVNYPAGSPSNLVIRAECQFVKLIEKFFICNHRMFPYLQLTASNPEYAEFQFAGLNPAVPVVLGGYHKNHVVI